MNKMSRTVLSHEIIHNSEFFGGNASEYIVPGGSIDITSHGMGSGIYGLSQIYLDKNPSKTSDNVYTFTLDSPYIIKTEKECENYINASKHLMRELQRYAVNAKISNAKIGTKIDRDKFVKIAIDFRKIIRNNIFDIDQVTESLLKFWYDYHNRKDIVEMPINYVLKDAGMDGVVSEPGVSCHAWNKGNVKFIQYPSYKSGDSMYVAYILSRKGIDRILTDLTTKNYVLNSDTRKWVKQPDKIRTCRYCTSLEHTALTCPQRKQLMGEIYCIE